MGAASEKIHMVPQKNFIGMAFAYFGKDLYLLQKRFKNWYRAFWLALEKLSN